MRMHIAQKMYWIGDEQLQTLDAFSSGMIYNGMINAIYHQLVYSHAEDANVIIR